MKKTKLLMGMPITVEVIDTTVTANDLEAVYEYFQSVDEQFSPFKSTSEVTKLNAGLLKSHELSQVMKLIMKLGEQTKRETGGFFNMFNGQTFNPSGLVKGWAILNASKILKDRGFSNFYVDAGGDIQIFGKNREHHDWVVGIRNPFNRYQNIKIVSLTNKGIATSGTTIRGQHIYNPHAPTVPISDIVSLTVIGPNVYEADRFATAGFAMGQDGIRFIDSLPGFEGYMIDRKGTATYTHGFSEYLYV